MNHRIKLQSGDTVTVDYGKPRPEHYDGEPCNLPVWEGSMDIGEGMRFEYTSECRVKGDANHYEWGVLTGTSHGDVISYGHDSDPQWILRAIPVETNYQRGDIIVSTLAPGLSPELVYDIRGDTFFVLFDNGGGSSIHKSNCRHATDDEVSDFYTVEGKNGERARFYRDNVGDIKMVAIDGSFLWHYPGGDEAAERLEWQAVKNYFNLGDHLIMPLPAEPESDEPEDS